MKPFKYEDYKWYCSLNLSAIGCFFVGDIDSLLSSDSTEGTSAVQFKTNAIHVEVNIALDAEELMCGLMKELMLIEIICGRAKDIKRD